MDIEEYFEIAKTLEPVRTSVVGICLVRKADPFPMKGFQDITFESKFQSLPSDYEPVIWEKYQRPLMRRSASIDVNFYRAYDLLLDPSEAWLSLPYWKSSNPLDVMWVSILRNLPDDKIYTMLLLAKYEWLDLQLEGHIYYTPEIYP